MKAIMDDLTKLGKEIDKAKTSVSQLEGRESEVVKRLKEEFGITTLAEVDELLTEYSDDLLKEEQSIRADFAELKKDFQW